MINCQYTMTLHPIRGIAHGALVAFCGAAAHTIKVRVAIVIILAILGQKGPKPKHKKAEPNRKYPRPNTQAPKERPGAQKAKAQRPDQRAQLQAGYAWRADFVPDP